ncbi:MAG: hypothetical protein ABIZ70_07050 [Gemmatimonadales bacterium]
MMTDTRTALLLLLLPLAACGDRTTSKTDTTAVATQPAAPTPPPVAPAADPAAPASPGAFVVKADEFNSYKTGMTLAKFNEAVGEQLKPKYDISPECDILRPAKFPKGVTAMIILDTIVRFDIDSAGILTTEGAGVGDTEARIKELYQGQLKVQPHKYTGPTGHYLVVSPAGDALHRIIFETDGKKVLNYRVGNRPAVELVEGCS